MEREFDVVVIGAGPAGEIAAGRLSERGGKGVAVGTGAALPPIPGLSELGAWSNREITTTSEVPRRLIVLGGGVVGVEMAQAWRSLGAEVVVIEALDRLLPREEPFAGAELEEALVDRGIEVHTGVRAIGATRDGHEVTVELASGGGVAGSHLLVAIGRRPLTNDIGLETVGLEPGRYIEVDDQLRVPGKSWLYAVGDVNGRSLLVGATFVGPEVADFVHAATIAVVGQVPLRTLAHAIAPFPTRSELWLKLTEAYEQRRDGRLLAGSLHSESRPRVAVAA